MKQSMVLLICGGGGSEHNISVLSADFFETQLKKLNVNYLRLTLLDHFLLIDQQNHSYQFTSDKNLLNTSINKKYKIDYIIPAIHGSPGENGAIQSFFDLQKISYFGSNSEASMLCFNKISTKLWAQKLGIEVTPFELFSDNKSRSIEKAKLFLKKHKDIFIKATHQGSSVGVFHVTSEDKLLEIFKTIFDLSPYVLLEKTLKARELEVAVFEYNGKIIATKPGEIELSNTLFYSFDEKYSESSRAKVCLEAPGIPQSVVEHMLDISKELFRNLKLKDLARIDFFLEGENVILNEINTFPGHTKTSMFPMLLEHTGLEYKQYLKYHIYKK